MDTLPSSQPSEVVAIYEYQNDEWIQANEGCYDN